jgi:predicted esterase
MSHQRLSAIRSPMIKTWALCVYAVALLSLNTQSTFADRCARITPTAESRLSPRLLLIERPPTPPNPSAPLVIGLHGLGDRADRFHHLSQRLPLAWRVVTIEAPWLHPTRPDGRQWYRYRCPQAAKDVAISAERVLTTVRHLLGRYPKRSGVALYGFSQGGVMTLAVTARQPTLFEASVSLSGYWIGEEAQIVTPKEYIDKVLMIHGTDDTVVPLQKGRHAFELFERAGYEPQWFSFNGRHTLPKVALDHMISHIQRRLSLATRETRRKDPPEPAPLGP